MLDTYEHDLKLNGDFGLNPGRKVKLQIPKAIDPTIYKEYSGKSAIYLYDEVISGTYLVTSVIHSFEDNEYYSNVRVKRDSLSLKLQ